MVMVLKSLAEADTGGASDASPLGFSKLVPVLNRHRAVITFGQSGPSIASELTASGLSVALIPCTTMEQAMHAAAETGLPAQPLHHDAASNASTAAETALPGECCGDVGVDLRTDRGVCVSHSLSFSAPHCSKPCVLLRCGHSSSW
ncbi:unnamed protein product [Closterium sp. Naga37s-1]|nr:unnamed protein product [Closterium sp. Naga37s-1]